ncbi:MAG: TonB-dependent receptor [Sphingomonadaceae bacterium]|nr:TonB-dependent receptor [Sphingomonadaceae bacterium]
MRYHWLLGAALIAQPALAQRTEDNATTQAEDAFGKSVGDQSIGIYNPYDVRGFSPVDAGNVRIEGLYFDQQASLTERLAAGSTIRVGLSAQSYPFPAPTGIADFTLRKPGDHPLASFALNYGPYNVKSAEADFQLPLDGARLGLVAGAAIYRDGEPYGGTPQETATAILLHWSPRPGIDVTPFYSRNRRVDDEQQPLIFTDGAFLPKRFPRNPFFGQDWADFAGTFVNYGVLARADPLGFDVRLGVFRSINDNDKTAADLLFGTARDGSVADRIVVIENGDKSASTSGELRVAKSFDEGPRRHTLIVSARGRAQDRRYGGADFIDLGASTSLGPDPRPEPSHVDGPKTFDRVRQTTVGVGYQGKWRGVGEVSIGIQKTRYTKRITDPDPAIVFPETRASPWLPSATAALYLAPSVALYAGYTRGLEESPVAPSDAVNLNEAPPAIRTRQKDGGVRWTISPSVTAVLGAFEVEKPYFNLDPARRFRQLGQVTNRGIEFSIAGQVAPGLSLVAGNVLLDAKVSGEEVAAGRIGPRPVGTFRRHTIISMNYSVPTFEALSFDAYFEGTSNRTANSANTLLIPERAIVNLGTRYRFKVGETALLVRAQVQNVTNTFGWNVGGSGFFVPNGARRWLLSVAADV